MAILFVCTALLALSIAAIWSCVRSYFDKGYQRGMEDATQEILRGVKSHYEFEGGISQSLRKAILDVGISVTLVKKRNDHPFHAQLWLFADAMGDACWRRGHAAALRKMAVPEGKIRIEMSANELLHLSRLAHLGFQHMMPNYRGFEMHRFSGEDEAREGTHAVARIELAVPAPYRPSGEPASPGDARQALISNWWQPETVRLRA